MLVSEDDCLLEIAPLSDDEVDTIINTELMRTSRTLTVEQRMVRAPSMHPCHPFSE